MIEHFSFVEIKKMINYVKTQKCQKILIMIDQIQIFLQKKFRKKINSSRNFEKNQ